MLVPRFYEDLNVMHDKTMPARTYYIPASVRMNDLVEHRERSDRFQLLNGEWNVPVSYRGAGSSAVILRVVPCRNFPSVRMVQSGSRVKDSLRMEVMFRQRGILFSLTGKMTEALTM